jgi:hypothetical protein
VMIAPSVEVDELVRAIGNGASELTRLPLTDQEAAAIEASLVKAPLRGGA